MSKKFEIVYTNDYGETFIICTIDNEDATIDMLDEIIDRITSSNEWDTWNNISVRIKEDE